MNELKSLKAIIGKSEEQLNKIMETKAELNINAPIKALMVISVALTDYACNEHNDNAVKIAFVIKDKLDEIIDEAICDAAKEV